MGWHSRPLTWLYIIVLPSKLYCATRLRLLMSLICHYYKLVGFKRWKIGGKHCSGSGRPWAISCFLLCLWCTSFSNFLSVCFTLFIVIWVPTKKLLAKWIPSCNHLSTFDWHILNKISCRCENDPSNCLDLLTTIDETKVYRYDLNRD